MLDQNLATNYIQNNDRKNLEVNQIFSSADNFLSRHIGSNSQEIDAIINILGFSNIDQLIDTIIPHHIRYHKNLSLPEPKSEHEALAQLKSFASKNKVFRSYIGMGYHDCITPSVIQRNILENPSWYTAYTPYQAEISQGRLEALINYQTMIIELTGLEIANASLLDEGTAAAEAMSMSYFLCKNKTAHTFFVSSLCHPQTIQVLQTRANPLNIKIIVDDHRTFKCDDNIFGALLQYPATDGSIHDYRCFIEDIHEKNALVTVAADLLSLALITPPGEFGADIAIGTTQRFGVPLGYGGPHAAYFATRERYKRQIPGRIVGVSKDVRGNPALRLALQTREQHIKREKATSNICTAQVLLAIVAGMYAVYHGPEGIKNIALKIYKLAVILKDGLKKLNYVVSNDPFFDTINLSLDKDRQNRVIETALEKKVNLRLFKKGVISISLNETTTVDDIVELWQIFAEQDKLPFSIEEVINKADFHLPLNLERTTPYLIDPIFSSYHSENELIRYLHQLEKKDLALNTSMIPLGSCTMKLNATAEMTPVTWPEFSKIHPFVPLDQALGYGILFQQLEQWLGEITGFSGISLQPNAGSQGEYAGLQVILRYHKAHKEIQRNICLIPESAHGTNPASAVMCGMKVIVVKCDKNGNIDILDLKQKAKMYEHNLAALMITYPSTHGVFEKQIIDICSIIHHHGGQVYMDGANMNAQVGLIRPADIGADVCHLNLHKTFCIPHGGGGPGVGPIGVKSHLVRFLPNTNIEKYMNPYDIKEVNLDSIGAVSAAPWGSANILVISWMYIAMMGSKGLTQATKIAILNANYIAHRLSSYYPILFKGDSGYVAHECIIDLRPLKKQTSIEVEDIAKRLMDFGFHAPTISWPVIGTMMIEPTESENLPELDRFCNAMIAIYEEVKMIASGEIDRTNNPLKNCPHTAIEIACDEWNRPYSREKAAYPSPWTKKNKFWPSVGRIDNAFGDRNLVCSCDGMEAYKQD
ncbi:MAG: glycine dehydrogenase (decarboxylating) alpha subunit [Candidatus Atelocyanobacterium thalassa isolate SIO64986]|uniref:Glycine dehydrogenase (decarboxylating) n=1 Tax=Candidatus Atelocyanobacterium thalassa isolate SIO64986 TaxID=1527444 RepID=A0A086CIR8_9CHRO|nr:MAG: glycine dehydrogenase (decarboxylating) alpha subunit [Candidatus Atelocyanobacterium thalassa isolate SIO64986]